MPKLKMPMRDNEAVPVLLLLGGVLYSDDRNNGVVHGKQWFTLKWILQGASH